MTFIPAYPADANSILRHFPQATILDTPERPAEKPFFALIEIPEDEEARRERLALALHFAMEKVPFALQIAASELPPGMGRILHHVRKNRVPAVLLDSIRYVPAVAALKETAVSGILGNEFSASLGVAPNITMTPLREARLLDAARWISGAPLKGEMAPDASFPFAIQIQGTVGSATARFSEDGQRGELVVSTPYHTHLRRLPTADPRISELAILAASVFDETRLTKKIKELPLLMSLTDGAYGKQQTLNMDINPKSV